MDGWDAAKLTAALSGLVAVIAAIGKFVYDWRKGRSEVRGTDVDTDAKAKDAELVRKKKLLKLTREEEDYIIARQQRVIDQQDGRISQLEERIDSITELTSQAKEEHMECLRKYGTLEAQHLILKTQYEEAKKDLDVLSSRVENMSRQLEEYRGRETDRVKMEGRVEP